MKMKRNILFTVVILSLLITGTAGAGDLPDYLMDRGEGVPLSMFGTYIMSGELIIYPFYEYYYDHDAEYAPDEFGFADINDYRGKYTGHEGLIFIGYGITEDLAAEFEVAYISARLEKSDDDPSGMPEEVEESGLGDVEGQIRWRFLREQETRPEAFTYFETVFPTGEKDSLIGTSDWEFKLGLGLTKGFGFGTMTLRTAVARDLAENKTEVGEYAVEYLRRLSEKYRIYLAIEGEQDEIEMIPELQWHFRKNMFAKCSLAFGLTSKATDFAPEIGVMFSFR
jgi:hypothetical protein